MQNLPENGLNLFLRRYYIAQSINTKRFSIEESNAEKEVNKKTPLQIT
jgi:hypothetical protein